MQLEEFDTKLRHSFEKLCVVNTQLFVTTGTRGAYRGYRRNNE